jgi:hypothetical protein
MTKTLLLFAMATATAACTSAPAAPAWQPDVLPIIASNCVRCHGSPAAFGAPPSFRLDHLLDDTTDPDTGLVIHGAATMYYRIRDRVDDGTMPPELPLVGDAPDVIDNWAAQAVPGDVVHDTYATPPLERGPGNAPPSLALTGAADDYHYVIDDPDRDLVEGKLTVADVVVASGLRAGQGEVHLDLSQVPDGTYPVIPVLDDGVVRTLPAIFQVTVSGHGATPTAITFVYPRPMAMVARADTRKLALCATAATTASIFAVDPRSHARTTLATNTAIAACGADPVANATNIDWQAFKDALTPDVSDWKLEVEVGGRVVATSPRFRISHAAASGAYADVKDILADKCGAECHKPCGAYPATLPYDFSVYQGKDTCGRYYGVGEEAPPGTVPYTPGLLYERVVVRQDMPPASAPQLTADERKAVAAWILGGARP